MFSATLDVLGFLKSRREKRSGDVFDFARRLARGESIDPDALLTAANAAGLTDEDFAEAVDMIRRRNEARRTAATAEAAEAAIATLQAEIDRHEVVLKAARKRFEEAVEPLQEQKLQAEARLAAASAAKESLRSPHNLPRFLVERREAARKKLHAVSGEERRVEAIVERTRKRAEDAFAILEKDGGFERAERQYLDPVRRKILDGSTIKLVEDVLHGRHRAKEGAEELAKLTRAREEAQADFDAAERGCLEF